MQHSSYVSPVLINFVILIICEYMYAFLHTTCLLGALSIVVFHMIGTWNALQEVFVYLNFIILHLVRCKLMLYSICAMLPALLCRMDTFTCKLMCVMCDVGVRRERGSSALLLVSIVLYFS